MQDLQDAFRALDALTASFPAETLEALARESDFSSNANPTLAEAMSAFRGSIRALVTEREADIALRLTLRLAAHISRSRSQVIPELVWTGPAVIDAPLRSTPQVLGELVAGAHDYVVLVGYRISSGGQALSLLPELVSAARRGVRLTLVLDHEQANYDVVRSRTWPDYNQPRLLTWSTERDGLAKLHAKVTIADDTAVLITSANPTFHGMERNIELGVLLRGPVAFQVRQRFSALERLGLIQEWR